MFEIVSDSGLAVGFVGAADIGVNQKRCYGRSRPFEHDECHAVVELKFGDLADYSIERWLTRDCLGAASRVGAGEGDFGGNSPPQQYSGQQGGNESSLAHGPFPRG